MVQEYLPTCTPKMAHVGKYSCTMEHLGSSREAPNAQPRRRQGWPAPTSPGGMRQPRLEFNGPFLPAKKGRDMAI
jgi:hypothetical protein